MTHRQLKSNIKQLAKNMRNQPTRAEHILWEKVLRKKQLGCLFRRQFIIDNKYIADFICFEKRLIIELDG